MTSSHLSADQKYREDDLPQFTPMPWSLKQIRDAIPQDLFVKQTTRGLAYLGRDISFAALAWSLATYIDPFFARSDVNASVTPLVAELLRWSAWAVYWWFQGLIFTGIWVIGHECGHGGFSDYRTLNDSIGFVVHSFLFTPYFSWKISHHRHHSNHASMERDEVYVPKTRSGLGLPEQDKATAIDYDEILGDTPIYTLYMLIRQQLLAFPAYLLFNVSGQPNYPKWTNHFDPNSILFMNSQRNAVIMSNLGISSVILILRHASSVYGFSEVVKYYGIPWLLVTHWFIMITYLHHTDPVVPHYRNKAWNVQRGAAATVDRPFLGWQGRFFLHDVAHYHVIHHFFPKLPFYNGERATKHLKEFIGDHYLSSDRPAFEALWDNYNKCQFVEDDGDVLFYRDKKGRAIRRPTEGF
ncbi:fatty acid desaturase-domain-containing protein [Lyophyllum atratum]|nr:fatty acid desaturase-domain-containing protein [Lyophyllum atratum]